MNAAQKTILSFVTKIGSDLAREQIGVANSVSFCCLSFHILVQIMESEACPFTISPSYDHNQFVIPRFETIVFTFKSGDISCYCDER